MQKLHICPNCWHSVNAHFHLL